MTGGATESCDQYLDSSVVLRILLNEKGALELKKGGRYLSSELIRVECMRTLFRMSHEGLLIEEELDDLFAKLHAALMEIHLIRITSLILNRSAERFIVHLSSLDAIHFASFLLWSERNPKPTRLCTHDRQLGKAALRMGFDVVGI